MTAVIDRPEVVTVTKTPEAPAPVRTGVMTIVTYKGVEVVNWDTSDEGTVKTAQERFTAARSEGMLGYEVKGDERTQLHNFTTEAEAIVFTAPLVGG